jgi:hypothetical protein
MRGMTRELLRLMPRLAPAALLAAGALHAADADPSPRAPDATERQWIGDYIREHVEPLEDCYARRLRYNGSLRGKLLIRFDIAGNGDVMKPTADGMNDSTLVECVVNRMATWKFSKASGSTLRVAYPLVFAPGQVASIAP